ncbi:MAG: acylneuraminate cytidylyltransferase family protein, partial [Candidatus Peribacteraceae bacterium]|nr:acylneuraminate cytidylyltransferase family protein [Candidatus Peribacteraceae bacterium]
MTETRKTLAIIPARGGSQGVPGKNIRLLHGHPMIAWSITYGLQCPGIDRVVVSTDSEEIREVARAYGAEVPFLRPKDLAGPKSMVEGALLHAVEYYEQEENYHPDRIVLLQPTSPLRLADTMD